MLAGCINTDGSTPFDPVFLFVITFADASYRNRAFGGRKKEMQMILSRSFFEWICSITNLQTYVSGAGLKCIYQTVGGD